MSYAILGMAIHSATDTYAHRAWVKENGEWIDVKAVYDEDNVSVVSARAEAAQITCSRSLFCFMIKEPKCVTMFRIADLDGYGGNKEGTFRLRNYQKCADEITDQYKNELEWYSYTK